MTEKPASEHELYQLLKLMTELGITLRTSGDAKNPTLVSSFDKSLMPFLTELQPKVEKPAYDPKANYYLEFWKVFVSNEILISSLKEISLEKVLMEQKIREYEKIYQELEQQVKPTKKKRRKAKDIAKNFVCPYPACKKKYGSNVSLNLHIKRTHNGGNKSEREKYAKEVFEALRDKTPVPSSTMSLYPSFMKDVENEFLRLKAINFQDEFQPGKLFSYTMDGLDHMMEEGDEDEDSWTDGEEEAGEEEEDEGEEETQQNSNDSNHSNENKEQNKKKGNYQADDESLSGYSMTIHPADRRLRRQNSEDKDSLSGSEVSSRFSEHLVKRRPNQRYNPNTFHDQKTQKKVKKA